MMTLYSGITCPFSQRCRFVLYEKGMDFEIKENTNVIIVTGVAGFIGFPLLFVY